MEFFTEFIYEQITGNKPANQQSLANIYLVLMSRYQLQLWMMYLYLRNAGLISGGKKLFCELKNFSIINFIDLCFIMTYVKITQHI